MVRAFISLAISTEARAALAEVIERLRQQTDFSAVRWVKPEVVHLTIKFLGEIPETEVQTVFGAAERAVQGTGAMTLTLSGIGAFPNLRNPKILWIGLGGDSGRLKALHKRIDQEINSVSGFPLEKRDFSPHLTLARVRDTASNDQRRRIGQALSEVTLETEICWRVSEVNLTVARKNRAQTYVAIGRFEEADANIKALKSLPCGQY